MTSRPLLESPVRSARAALDRRTVLALLAAAPAGALAAAHTGEGKAVAERPAPDAPGPTSAAAPRFLRAVVDGDVELVTALLDADARLAAATDAAGRSAFLLARLNDRDEIAALLLARGIELDIVEAALAGAWDRFDALAEARPEQLNAAHPVGGNPLYAGALAGGERFFHLRSRGVDPDGRPPGGSGLTPARAAMDCSNPLDAWLAAIDLLSNGADVNAPQAGGDSVLHGAVRRRDPRIVRLALRKGADLALRDLAGRTPRDLASALAWSEGLAMLQDPAAVPRDHRASRLAFRADRTPFVWAPLEGVPRARQSAVTSVSHFSPERLRAFLAEDPRLVRSVSTDAELAIEACAHTGQRENIRLHLDHGAPLALPTALSLGDLDHARWLLEGDPRLIHERGAHDMPLTWYVAIGGDDPSALTFLREFGADLEQESAGETVLHQAAWRNRPELVQALLAQGADAGAVGHRQFREGRTPRELAATRENADVLAIFREFGVDA